jgi:hypothetical protein
VGAWVGASVGASVGAPVGAWVVSLFVQLDPVSIRYPEMPVSFGRIKETKRVQIERVQIECS